MHANEAAATGRMGWRRKEMEKGQKTWLAAHLGLLLLLLAVGITTSEAYLSVRQTHQNTGTSNYFPKDDGTGNNPGGVGDPSGRVPPSLPSPGTQNFGPHPYPLPHFAILETSSTIQPLIPPPDTPNMIQPLIPTPNTLDMIEPSFHYATAQLKVPSIKSPSLHSLIGQLKVPSLRQPADLLQSTPEVPSIIQPVGPLQIIGEVPNIQPAGPLQSSPEVPSLMQPLGPLHVIGEVSDKQHAGSILSTLDGYNTGPQTIPIIKSPPGLKITKPTLALVPVKDVPNVNAPTGAISPRPAIVNIIQPAPPSLASPEVPRLIQPAGPLQIIGELSNNQPAGSILPTLGVPNGGPQTIPIIKAPPGLKITKPTLALVPVKDVPNTNTLTDKLQPSPEIPNIRQPVLPSLENPEVPSLIQPAGPLQIIGELSNNQLAGSILPTLGVPNGGPQTIPIIKAPPGLRITKPTLALVPVKDVPNTNTPTVPDVPNARQPEVPLQKYKGDVPIYG